MCPFATNHWIDICLLFSEKKESSLQKTSMGNVSALPITIPLFGLQLFYISFKVDADSSTSTLRFFGDYSLLLLIVASCSFKCIKDCIPFAFPWTSTTFFENLESFRSLLKLWPIIGFLTNILLFSWNAVDGSNHYSCSVRTNSIKNCL